MELIYWSIYTVVDVTDIYIWCDDIYITQIYVLMIIGCDSDIYIVDVTDRYSWKDWYM